MKLDDKLDESNMPYANGCMMAYPFEQMAGMDDTEYMKSMYPPCTRGIMLLIEDLCDQMEADGSTMYDEYPDKVRVEAFTKHLYDTFEGEKNQWVYALFKVLMVQEMQLRRLRRNEWKRRLQQG